MLGNSRFLIVDDHMLARQMVSATLTELGAAQVDSANDGVTGLNKIKQALSAGTPYDVIFLDWHMPQMNGYDLLNLLRCDKQYNDMAIIMLTAESEDANIIRALEVGATAYIVKPFNKNALLEKFKDIVTWREKRLAKA